MLSLRSWNKQSLVSHPLRRYISLSRHLFLWFAFVGSVGYGILIWYSEFYTLGQDDERIEQIMKKEVFTDINEKQFESLRATSRERKELFSQDDKQKKDLFGKEQ